MRIGQILAGLFGLDVKTTPREQEILTAGMLSKAHILDLLKNFVIYEVVNNKKVKKLAKHQQYRIRN